MVRFWDTSALIPLVLRERSTVVVQSLFAEDPAVVAFWATRIECTSALVRRRREEPKSVDHSVHGTLSQLASRWTEVVASEAVREHAERLLHRHVLRSADAMQMAAALVWARGAPRGHGFVSLDDRLREVARTEGFAVLPSTE